MLEDLLLKEPSEESLLPEYLILDLEDSIVPLMNYIAQGYSKRYIEINSLLNDLLNTVCTDNPDDALQDRIAAIEDVLIEEEFPAHDIYYITQLSELLGLRLIQQLQDLGFYNLTGFWGYQISRWLSPTVALLTFSLDYDITTPMSRIDFVESEDDTPVD